MSTSHRGFSIRIQPTPAGGFDWFAYTEDNKPVSVCLTYNVGRRNPPFQLQEEALRAAKSVIDRWIKQGRSTN